MNALIISMNNKGIFDGWFEAFILVAAALIFLCFLAAFPGGGTAALEYILNGVRCFLGTCQAFGGITT